MTVMHSGRHQATHTDNEYPINTPPTLEEDQEAYELAIKDLTTNMTFRLHNAFYQGRNGWNRPNLCPTSRLIALFQKALAKGDVIDMANYLMMIHGRGIRNLEEVNLAEQLDELNDRLTRLTAVEISLQMMGESPEDVLHIRKRLQDQKDEVVRQRRALQP